MCREHYMTLIGKDLMAVKTDVSLVILQIYPINGGKPCPEKLIKHKKCKINCFHIKKNELTALHKSYFRKVDCLMSKWTKWTPCSKTCGTEATQERMRFILVHPKGEGKKCPHHTERRRCNLSPCITANDL